MPWKCSCGWEHELPGALNLHIKRKRPPEEAAQHSRAGWEDPETREIFPQRPKNGKAGEEATKKLVVKHAKVVIPLFRIKVKQTDWEFSEALLSKWSDIFRAAQEQMGFPGRPESFLDRALEKYVVLFELQPVGFVEVKREMEVKHE